MIQYTIIIDTDHLAGVAQPERDWLKQWLRNANPQRLKNIAAIGCASSVEARRVTAMLTGRGLPPGSIITRGGA